MAEKKSPPAFWILQIFLLLLLLLLGIWVATGYTPRSWKAREMRAMEERVRTMQELVTVNQLFRDVIYKEERKFISDKRVLFSIRFIIQAGVDLSRARVEWDEKDRPRVMIPAAEIIRVDADESSIEQIFLKEQFSTIRQGDYMKVILQEKERLSQEALDRGIIAQAEEQADLILRQLFYLAGYQDIIILPLEES